MLIFGKLGQLSMVNHSNHCSFTNTRVDTMGDKPKSLFLSKIKKRVSKVLAIKIPDEKNAFRTEQINEICDLHSIKCEQINNINDALKYFRSNKQKIYLITGSLYLIGKIRRKLL